MENIIKIVDDIWSSKNLKIIAQAEGYQNSCGVFIKVFKINSNYLIQTNKIFSTSNVYDPKEEHKASEDVLTDISNKFWKPGKLHGQYYVWVTYSKDEKIISYGVEDNLKGLPESERISILKDYKIDTDLYNNSENTIMTYNFNGDYLGAYHRGFFNPLITERYKNNLEDLQIIKNYYSNNQLINNISELRCSIKNFASKAIYISVPKNVIT